MTGDQADIAGRIKAVLPRWFGPASPLLDALLQGLANGAAFAYTLYLYAKLQTRILTATDGWLDMIAADFFGPNVLRAANQSDASYRAAIIANMFRERATRNAITLVLKALTGRAPVIVEPQRPADCGVYGASVQVSQPGVTSYINGAGLLVFVPPNTPRYQNAQLLIEAASTNLLLHSNQFDDPYWGKTRSSVVPNAITALDGTTTGYKLVEDTSVTNTHGLVKSSGLGLVSGTSYTYSIPLKAGERTVVVVTLFGLAGGEATFDLAHGLFAKNSAVAAASMTALAGGGWLISATWNFTGVGVGPSLNLSNSATTVATVQSYTGDGVSGVYLLGDAQLEVGSVATTRIRTTTAAVSRAADTLLNAGSGAGGAAYGSAGAYGSMLLPYQAFVTAFRPLASGVPNVAGYGISSAGYGVASQGEYVNIASVTGAVQDADINAAIDAVKPAGTTLWTRISS